MSSFWIDIRGRRYSGDYPGQCPICCRTVAIEAHRQYSCRYNSDIAQAVLQCPGYDCQSFFIAYYRLTKEPIGTNPISPSPLFIELVKLEPSLIQVSSFEEFINKTSPGFVEIFNQAEEALARGLRQVAGPGFRKAFKFLLKDYIKSTTDDEVIHSEVESSFVGPIVQKYLTDEKLRGLAERTLWLGNDQVHYRRKWDQHDIDDLIKLIKLTISWIHLDQSFTSYQESMPKS